MRDLHFEGFPSFDPASHIVISPPHSRPKGASGLVLHLERLKCGRLLVPGILINVQHEYNLKRVPWESESLQLIRGANAERLERQYGIDEDSIATAVIGISSSGISQVVTAI